MKKLNLFIFVFSLSCLIFSSKTMALEIDSAYIVSHYSEIADKIIDYTEKDSSSWTRLSYLCDVFGSRLSGSIALNNAIDWMFEEMKSDGFSNVRKEEVMVPHWVQHNSSAELVFPYKKKIDVLALGGSVPTPNGGISAPVLVVESFEDLQNHKEDAKGKIVVYNFPFDSYGRTFQYRWSGADQASKYGAVGSLIRSLTQDISVIPHTGVMRYMDSVPKIPGGAISPQDAALLGRLQKHGITPILKIKFDTEILPDTISYNVMGEITGSEFPNEIIALGGHTDSWDVGLGAHDNGGGCIATWNAAKTIKELGLKPRRTVRVVQWVNEENGTRGGQAYAEKHKNEKHALVFEFDSGVFEPSVIGFTGDDKMLAILKGMEPLLKKINPNMIVRKGGGGVDIGPMMKLGIPGMSLGTNDEGKYFLYHHSAADTPEKVDPKNLNQCIAAIAIAIYIYADLPDYISTK